MVKAHSQAQGDKGLHEVMGAGFRAMFKQLCVLTAEGLSLRGLSMHSCHQCSIFSRVHLADINLRSSVMLKKKEASLFPFQTYPVTPGCYFFKHLHHTFLVESIF